MNPFTITRREAKHTPWQRLAHRLLGTGHKTIRNFVLYLAVLGTLFAVAYRNLLNSTMLGFPDLVPFPPSPDAAIATFFAPWNPSGFGAPAAPGNFVLGWGLLEVVLPPPLAQKLFFLSLLPLAGVLMYSSTGEFIDSWAIRASVSIAYSLNVFAIGQFAAGEGSLLFYALLPILYASWRKAVLDQSVRQRRVHFLVFTLLAGLSWAIYINGLVVLLLLFVVPLAHFVAFGQRSTRFRALTVTLAGAIGSMLVNIRFLLSPIFEQGSAIAGSGAFLQATQAVYAQQVATPISAFAFASTPAVAPVLAAICAAGLVFSRRGSTHGRLLELLATLLLVSGAMWATGTGLLVFLFKLSPIVTFRDPHVPMYALTFAIFLSAGISAETIAIGVRRHFTSSRRRQPSVISILRLRKTSSASGSAKTSYVLLAAVLLLMPVALTAGYKASEGSLGIDPQKNYQFQRFEYSPYIPRAYSEAYAWLANHGYTVGGFSALWLPLSYYTSARTVWYPSLNSATIGALPLDASSEYAKTLSVFFSDPRQPLGSLLAMASVKYVVIDLTSPFNGPIQVFQPSTSDIGVVGHFPLGIVGSPAAFLDYFEQSTQFNKTYSTAEVTIFENLDYEGMFQAYSGLARVYPPLSRPATYTVGRELIANGNFTEGLTNWSITRSVRIVTDTNFENWSRIQTQAAITQYNLPVRENRSYRFTFEFRGPLNGSWSVKFLWFNSTVPGPTDALAIGATYIGPTQPSSTPSPGWESTFIVAPPMSAYVAVIVYAGSDQPPDQYLDVRGFSLEQVYGQTPGRDLPDLGFTAWANDLADYSPTGESVYYASSANGSPVDYCGSWCPSTISLFVDAFPSNWSGNGYPELLQRASDVLYPLSVPQDSGGIYLDESGDVVVPSGSFAADNVTIPMSGNWTLRILGSEVQRLQLRFGGQVANSSPTKSTNVRPNGSTYDVATWNVSITAPGNVDLTIASSQQAAIAWLLWTQPNAAYRMPPRIVGATNYLDSSGPTRFNVMSDGWTFVILRQAYDPSWVLLGPNTTTHFSLTFANLFVYYDVGDHSLTLIYQKAQQDAALVLTQFGVWLSFASVVAYVGFRRRGDPPLEK